MLRGESADFDSAILEHEGGAYGTARRAVGAGSGMEEDPQQSRWPSKKTVGALALTGGLGVLLYTFKDKIKKLVKWEESVEQTSQNSADLMTSKINLAQHLADANDMKGVLESLVTAKKEARKLSKINQEFEKRLASFSNLPDKLA